MIVALCMAACGRAGFDVINVDAIPDASDTIPDASDTRIWRLHRDGSEEGIYTLAEFHGRLYAGQGGANLGAGDILVYDGTEWTTSFDGGGSDVRCLTVFNGALYAGLQTDAPGGGNVIACKPASSGEATNCDALDWATSFDGAANEIFSFAVHKNRLYAGQGSATGAGDVLVCNPATTGDPLHCEPADWSTSYNGVQERILGLAEFGDALYAGQGAGPGDGDVLVFDGTDWKVSFDGTEEMMLLPVVYNGKLYVGQGFSALAGDVMSFDGASWTLALDRDRLAIRSLGVHDGRLYAGQAAAADDDIFVFDGVVWKKSYDGDTGDEINTLLSFGGKFYAGEAGKSGDGDIYVFE